MTFDPSVVPGLLLVAADLVTLAGIVCVILRAKLGEADDRFTVFAG